MFNESTMFESLPPAPGRRLSLAATAIVVWQKAIGVAYGLARPFDNTRFMMMFPVWLAPNNFHPGLHSLQIASTIPSKGAEGWIGFATPLNPAFNISFGQLMDTMNEQVVISLTKTALQDMVSGFDCNLNLLELNLSEDRQWLSVDGHELEMMPDHPPLSLPTGLQLPGMKVMVRLPTGGLLVISDNDQFYDFREKSWQR